MGEARRKKRAHAAILEACPDCIYCGGKRRANTIEHMPPRAMFLGKKRPKGLEFASCESCNAGTSHADLVASLIGRFWPDPPDEHTRKETRGLFTAVNNNIPGLLSEMSIPDDAEQAAHRHRLGLNAPGGFLRTNGPLVSAHMQTFAYKIGFALYYEVTKKIVPTGGAVAARWFSNAERMAGQYPPADYDFLLPRQTLRQGKFEVADQFGYQWRMTEDERSGIFVSEFRRSFAVVSFVTLDSNLLSDAETKHPIRACRPGDLTNLLQPG